MNLNIEDLHLITLNIGYSEQNGDWNWPKVRSPFGRLYCVTEGSAKIAFKEKEVVLRPGYLYFIPPFTLHDEISDGRFNHYYLHIYEQPGSNFRFLEELEYPVEVEAKQYDIELFRRLVVINPKLRLSITNPDMYDNQSTLLQNIGTSMQGHFSDKTESRGIILILISRFLEKAHFKHDAIDRRIQHVITYIHQGHEESFKLGKLADIACMSEAHFIRVFKQQMGITPNAYIISYKIELAQILLVTTDLPVKEIADKLGYYDSSYFNRLFRKMVGKSPLEYRRNSSPERNRSRRRHRGTTSSTG